LDNAELDRIATHRKDERYGDGHHRFGRDSGTRSAGCDNNINAMADEIGSQHRQLIQATFRETPFNLDVPAFGETGFAQALLECSDDVRRIRARARTEISD